MNEEKKINEKVKVIGEKVVVKDAVSITKREGKRIVGFGSGDSDGKQISADIDKEAGVKHQFEGQPARNKENELEVAQILVNKINLKNKLYKTPGLIEETDDIVDCISYGINDENLVLKIQIVNSNKDKEYWERIARTGSNISITCINDIIEQINKAIEYKSKKYGRKTVYDITLALDATQNPQHALTDVITNLKREHFEKLSTSGFSQIWIVGPSVNMTNQIYPVIS